MKCGRLQQTIQKYTDEIDELAVCCHAQEMLWSRQFLMLHSMYFSPFFISEINTNTISILI